MQATSRSIFFDNSELCSRRDLGRHRAYLASLSGWSRRSDCDSVGAALIPEYRGFLQQFLPRMQI